MTFAEHFKTNWLITLFASALGGALTTMFFMNQVENIPMIILTFVLGFIVTGAVVLGVWFIFTQQRPSKRDNS